MKKKIIIFISILLSVLFIVIGLPEIIKTKVINDSYETDEVIVKTEKDSITYHYSKMIFGGRTWYLYINGEYTGYRFDPFEAVPDKEFKEHLEKAELIKTILDEGDVRVYALPLVQYESKYKVFYTVDGKKFYEWKEDSYNGQWEEIQEVQERLDKLYQYTSEEELKKVSEETWE